MHLLQFKLVLARQQEDEFEDELLACVGLVCYGLEGARYHSVLRRSSVRSCHSFIVVESAGTSHSTLAYFSLHFQPLPLLELSSIKYKYYRFINVFFFLFFWIRD